MPYVESNFYSIINFLRKQQEDYDYYDRVWVQDVDRFGKCTIFVANSVEATECHYRLPFICETGEFFFGNTSIVLEEIL